MKRLGYWMKVSSAILGLIVTALLWMTDIVPSQPAKRAGKEECRDCHRRIWDETKKGSHGGLDCSSCHPNAMNHQDADDPLEVAAGVDYSAEACGSCHRFQYETYMKDEPGKAGLYGGTPEDPAKAPKLAEFPLYHKIVAGHGFTKDYNEERAHRYILQDHIETKRPKFPACLNCKATPIALHWGKTWNGVAISNDTKWEDIVKLIPKELHPYGVSCIHCHDPHNAELRIINRGLMEAIKERGVNPYWPERNAKSFQAADKQQKEMLLCGQCHVEYVCGMGADKKIRFVYSWRKARDLQAFYQERYGNQQDWVHSLIGETLVKSQHPELELFWESKYERAGASCVTCHMPKVEVKGRLLTSHWLTSPLKYLDKEMKKEPLGAYPCGQCHNVPPAVLKAQVLRLQQHIDAVQKRVQKALSDAIDALEAAKKAREAGKKVDSDLLQKAIDLYREAHLRWENLVVSENSMGFHNPEEVMMELAESLDNARQVEALARKAIGGP
ncbi:MAG: ammonia-forming cytochrome c nitrite reductase subunit c552 [Armatimonadetes bacterium]|nr:ammonia-forming cytochrome c nitrite reductase subunit c552 [Armatimonadota bacterium]